MRQSRAPAYTVSLGQSFSYLVAPHPPSLLFILPTLSKNSSDLSLSSQGAYYTQPVYAAQPHVIHHTTVVQPNSIPSAIYPAPVAAPRTNGVAMGMVAGTTMAMSAGKGNIRRRILCCLAGILTLENSHGIGCSPAWEIICQARELSRKPKRRCSKI